MVPPLDLLSRPRRNRRSPTIRAGLAETILRPENLILPVFIHDGEDNIPVASMPGVDRLGWRTGLLEEVRRARAVGVNAIDLFPKTPEQLKTPTAEEAYNPDGLVQRAIRLLKDTYPDLEIYTDVALDPYNSDGHDGIVRDDGVIMNDETVELLCRQALSQAAAGADCVSPSDMMDGRVGAIREALDDAGYTGVSIMSYTAKYASAFYGPFRDALGSAPKASAPEAEAPAAPRRRRPGGRVVPPNKRTYQQDPANARRCARPRWTRARAPTSSWSSRACPTWMSSACCTRAPCCPSPPTRSQVRVRMVGGVVVWRLPCCFSRYLENSIQYKSAPTSPSPLPHSRQASTRCWRPPFKTAGWRKRMQCWSPCSASSAPGPRSSFPTTPAAPPSGCRGIPCTGTEAGAVARAQRATHDFLTH